MVGAVVGFALQLGRAKKLQLENKKLQLEIELLKEKFKDEYIVRPNDQQIERYSREHYCVKSLEEKDTPYIPPPIDWQGLIALILASFVLVYFLYDLYRLSKWLFRFL